MRILFVLLLFSIKFFSQTDTIPTFNGVKNFYYGNGKLKSKFTYKNGKIDGPLITYNRNGFIMEQGIYANKRWVGDYKMHYDSGQVQQIFYFNENGKRDGLQRFYYKNGIIQIIAKYLNGKQDGYTLEYDSEGKLKKPPILFVNGEKTAGQDKKMLNEMLELVKKENALIPKKK